MPSYELAILLRRMARPELISALRRASESILDKGGLIRNMENLGSKPLPFKISEHGLVHREGSYFAIQFDSAPNVIETIKEELGRDVDFIRRNVFKIEEEEVIECTLHDELLPPAYRKDVQQMIKVAERKHRPKYKYNSGLDYYPFQK